MRIVVSILLLLHGIAHLPGFLVAWQLPRPSDLPYSTRLLADTVDIGDGGMRIMGVLWLIAGLACVVAAVAGVGDASGWLTIALAAVGFSLVLCIVGYPASRMGLAFNLVLLVVLLVMRTGVLTATR